MVNIKIIYFIHSRLKKASFLLMILALLFSCNSVQEDSKTALFAEGIDLIPYPQQVSFTGDDFIFGNTLSIVIDADAADNDVFTAQELKRRLAEEWQVRSEISSSSSSKAIILTRKVIPEEISNLDKEKSEQAYRIRVSRSNIEIAAKSEAGLFYGVQSLLQLIQRKDDGIRIIGMEITDWPDIVVRAAHYDTKHHQDSRSYVESFIRDLARYKMNMLVWEWEDKFEYPSHPEIGAPGAFTLEEMQEITEYARNYHVELVPLVQGLGHVSFILKWPQFSHLREIPASNWEFCPLKEGSYELLFDLWEDAIEATPGSKYIHIGSDETYELCKCDNCIKKAEEIGKKGVYHLFVKKAAQHLQELGREVMVWEIPQGWEKGPSPAKSIEPQKDLLLVEYATLNPEDIKASREAGYKVYIYDPNPGIEPLFLPYFYRLRGEGENEKEVESCLIHSHRDLSYGAPSGMFDGMINTSWDAGGCHNQVWMMSFINSAEFSWSGSTPGLDEFTDKFFLNYYGKNSKNMKELYTLLNHASYFYWKSFERRVWHYGDIGKTHLPDLPRGDNLEYDEYWNREYADKIRESEEELKSMERAEQIIKENIIEGIKNSYDLELYSMIVDLVKHTCNTYLALSDLEKAIKEAHNQRFLSHEAAYNAMENAVNIIDTNLNEREEVFNSLVDVWEKTQLPRGMSTPEKKFFHRMDRGRNFSYRRSDLSYLIYDEELLGLEKYREKLLQYMEYYKSTYLE